MANIADTLYRIYGSEETLEVISNNVKVGMCLREVLEAIGYKQPAVTKALAKSIKLYNDFTPTGGTTHSNEHLNEFMESLQIQYGSPLEEVNKTLKKCGIMPVNTDHFSMRGTIQYIDQIENIIDLQCDTAWDEQRDFITALKKRFADDEVFDVAFRCEEPGCDYYVSNVEGAIYGEYVSELDWQTEYHETFEDLCAAVRSYLQRNSIEAPSKWDDIDELQVYCYNHNNEHEEHPIFVHEFSII